MYIPTYIHTYIFAYIPYIHITLVIHTSAYVCMCVSQILYYGAMQCVRTEAAMERKNKKLLCLLSAISGGLGGD